MIICKATELVGIPKEYIRAITEKMTTEDIEKSSKQEEVLDLITLALDKFPWKNLEMSHFLKIELDKRFGCMWHVVVGEDFGFQITNEIGFVVHLYFGSVGILAWKCGQQLIKEVEYNSIDDSILTKLERKMKQGREQRSRSVRRIMP